MLEYEFVFDRCDIPVQLVDEIAPDHSTILGTGFGAAMDQCLGDVKSYRVIVRDGGAPLALVNLTESIGAMNARFGPLTLPLTAKIAVCGHPVLCTDCGVIARTRAVRDAWLPQILGDLPALLRRRGVGLLILKDIDAPAKIVENSGFFRLPSEPAMAMTGVARWRSFSNYTSDMRHKYRVKVNRARKHLQRKGIEIVFDDTAGRDPDRLYELYETVARRTPPRSAEATGAITHAVTNLPRRLNASRIDRNFFARMQQRRPQHTDLITLRNEERIVAFAMNFVDGDTYHPTIVGMEYGDDVSVLYRALLSATIERAIERRLDTIIFGRTGLTTKAELGARHHSVLCYATLTNPLFAVVNSISRWLAASVAPYSVPRRTVFHRWANA